jgi:hypothetical protein
MPWIKSPAWDLVWILNALWLGPLVLLLAYGHSDVRASPVDSLFFALTVPLWLGHRVSSAWLAYTTPAYRPLLASQPLRLIVLPLAIAVFCFAVLLAPEGVLPVPLLERVVWLAVLDYVLVSHHFAAQHFGLLSLYRGRAGRASDAGARRLDKWFALVVGGGFVVLAEALTGSIAFQDRWIDPWFGAGGGQALAQVLHDGGLACVVALTLLMLRAELRSARPSLPRAAYIVSVAMMVLSAFLARDPFLFIVLWSVQHWSAAMGLTSLVASRGAREPGLLEPVNRRGWAVLVALAVISTLLLPVMEVEAEGEEFAYADRIFGDAALWLRSSALVPALLALGFASGFIHYVLDRAVFRFSSAEVRYAARGLLRA